MSRSGCRRSCSRDRRPRGPFVMAALAASRSSRTATLPAPGRSPLSTTLDIEAVIGELRDQPEPHSGRTFSWANNAASRLVISSSISRRRFSQRSPTSSSRSPVVRSRARPCGRCRHRPDSSSDAARTRDPEVLRDWATEAPGLRAKSIALRRNSGRSGAGIYGLLSCSDHRYRSSVSGLPGQTPVVLDASAVDRAPRGGGL